MWTKSIWINPNDPWYHDDDPENLKKYWSGTSPTYTQSNSNASVAFYGSCWQYYDNDWHNNCDHSAEVITPILFESKWAHWPRYRHAPSDCPYTSSNIQYYKVALNGEDDIVCSSETYSTVNITGATYNWSSSKVSTTGSGYSTTATETSNGEGLTSR